jgi:fatty-acid desaturase
MPLSPTRSTTVTPSDTVPLPQGYDGTSPFPALCLLALALPLAAGRLIGGTWVYGLTALVWAGLVRIALLQHITRNVNSLCHTTGERP